MEKITFENPLTQQTSQNPPRLKDRGDAHIIVFGNEKGGSGKSTTAMHTAIALLRLGYKVASIDLDARQGTLSRYIKNRLQFITTYKKYIPTPHHLSIKNSNADAVETQELRERAFLETALSELKDSYDFVIVDTPGSHSFLSRVAHGLADTLITPLNDSYVDMDVLADIDPITYQIKGPSVYAKMVNDAQIERIANCEPPFNWIVMRNRLSHITAKNKHNIGILLTQMSERFGFKIAPGFGERVAFRELFLKGLTLLDLKTDSSSPLSISQIAARQEVRQLIMTLQPEKLKGHVRPLKKKAP